MKDLINYFKKFPSRFFIFGNIRRPIIPFKVNLLYWRPDVGDNVGDYISKVVYHWCLKKYGLKQYSLKTKRISLIGSVLSFVGGGKTTVWGSGLMNAESVSAILNPYKMVKLDIRSVRGPKTYEVLMNNGIQCADTFGDPGILMPLIYQSKAIKQKGKVLIIPHQSRYSYYAERYDNVINTYTKDYKAFIDEIVSSEKVISSSLHGIILAESYGVPAIFLNDYPGSKFKYDDYYQSTGRNAYPIADTIEEAKSMDGKVNISLSEMQKSLLESFPIDIFKKTS